MNDLQTIIELIAVNKLAISNHIKRKFDIPKYLILESNKLMCDYNEALKKEKDGNDTPNIN